MVPSIFCCCLFKWRRLQKATGSYKLYVVTIFDDQFSKGTLNKWILNLLKFNVKKMFHL